MSDLLRRLSTLDVCDYLRRADDSVRAGRDDPAMGPTWVPVLAADLRVLCRLWLDMNTAKCTTVPRITLPASDPHAEESGSSAP